MPDITITKLERDAAEGFWRARVNGVPVDRRYGCWQSEVRAAPHSRDFVRRDVLPPVAAKLQAKVRPIEKAERLAAAA
jgi:hypothetical protein